MNSGFEDISILNEMIEKYETMENNFLWIPNLV
jgi:hypothetical protein